MGGILNIEARDMDMKLLFVPESNNTLAKCMTNYQYWLLIASSGWPFVYVVLAVVGVGVTVVVVIIVAVVVVVVFLLSSNFCWAYAFHQDKASSVRVPVANVTLFSSAQLLRENTDSFPIFATGVPVGLVFLLGLLVLAIIAAYASRAAATLSATSFLMAA
ncbi:hypothetical protein Tco_0759055 [Tanacetum coccineum]